MDQPAPSRHLGLDLGGTNLKWAVVEYDPDGGWTTVATGSVPTRLVADADAVPAAVIAQMVELAQEVARTNGPIASVGVGVPGLYDPATGTARFLVNLVGPWDGQPIGGPIGEAIGVPCALINDARAFGLAELRLGAGRGASSMVGLTLGTGVGGVFAVDGRVHQGHDGTAGEWGHQTIDDRPDAPMCGCGNSGCLEAFTRADRICTACGTATPEEAVRNALAGDERAARGLAEVGRYLGIGIANMVTVVSPDVVVLGGGVATAGELLFAPIRAEVARRVRTTALDAVSIVPADLGVWSGSIGAAIHGAEQAGLASG
jgi:glucokinase